MSEPQHNPNLPATQSEEIRISDLILNIRSYFVYLARRWWLIGLIAIGCSALGFLYAWIQDEDYITNATYIIDSDATSNSFMSSLMSLAGTIGLGGGGSSEGFTNELLHGIIQSRRVIKGAMLEKRVIDGKFEPMGNSLIRLYPDWAEEENVPMDFVFPHDSLNRITPREDSVLELLFLKVREDHMSVSYDEVTALNTLTVRSLSRDLSVNLTNYVLEEASRFFIESSVQKEAQSLKIARHQFDSLTGVLQAKERRLANLTDQAGYNQLATNLLEQGRLMRDIEMMSLMYAEAYGLLRTAQTSLRDKKPIIEVVDQPQFATTKEEVKVVAFSIIFFMVGLFVGAIFFILRKLIQDILAEEQTGEVVVEAAPPTSPVPASAEEELN